MTTLAAAAGDTMPVPPQDALAERSLLGALLLDNSQISAAYALCGPEDFFFPAHGRAYKAILELAAKGAAVDGITLRAELLKHGMADKALSGDESLPLLDFFTGCIELAPVASHASRYAKIVRVTALKRAAIRAATAGLARLQNGISGAGITEVLSEIEAEFTRLRDLSDAAPFRATDLADITEPPPSVELLDAPGALTIGATIAFVAGQSSTRKSWLVRELISAVALGTPMPPIRKHTTSKCKTLWLALDSYRRRVYGRAAGLKTLIDRGHVKLICRGEFPGFDILNPKNRKQLVDYVKAEGFGLVVIDTIRWIHSADEMDQKALHDFVAALDEIVMAGAAVLGVCHSPKGTKDTDPSLDLLRGASSLGNAIHTAAVVKMTDPDVSEVSWVKCNDAHPWPECFSFQVVDGRFEYVQAAKTPGGDRLRNTVLDIILTLNTDASRVAPSPHLPHKATFPLIMDQVRTRVPKGQGAAEKTIRNLLAGLTSDNTITAHPIDKRGTLVYSYFRPAEKEEADVNF